MVSLLLAAIGVVCLALGGALLRSFGEAFRIGRILGGAPDAALGEARGIARDGKRAYVRVRGRIDAAEPFSDEHGRPLVLRRERVEVREGQRWRVLREARRQVPFVLRDRRDQIEIDAAALGEGLVVIPRESIGRAGEIPDRFEPPVDPMLSVRFRVDQVSTVEHAVAAGVPVMSGEDTVRLGPGAGRPLILTTVEIPEAMRLLARGRRERAVVAGALLVVGLACLAAALALAIMPVVLPANVLAASPGPTVAPGGDTRSSGEGAGLVGQPFLIALGVTVLGLASAALAVLYARLSRERS